MPSPASLCLFCGSRPGRDPALAEAAGELGRLLAGQRIRLVYGGGRVGLMGATADACMAAGGEVVGVIPRFLLRHEVGHAGLTRLEVVETMHERKMRMATLAEAFCVLPGGLGTLEELFEVLTWRQLGLHDKPILLLDLAGYWQPLLAMLRAQATAGFLSAGDLDLLRLVPSVAELPRALAEAPAPGPNIAAKWG